jgi:hypothetical protein
MLNFYKITEYPKKSLNERNFCLILAIELIEKYDFMDRGLGGYKAGKLGSYKARRLGG